MDGGGGYTIHLSCGVGGGGGYTLGCSESGVIFFFTAATPPTPRDQPIYEF